ncbi:MAG: hypothetical protein CM1200mP24_03800 [Gammaproteobacteria bacterium]|nr:MAG: hypothetical protein CM1200mP24_03800 [Gammaproteobacteria bacterium]
MPSGLALLNGDLYVGALNRILRYDDIDSNFHQNPKPSLITDRLPDKRHHGWKYLSIGPDGYLYVPVGALEYLFLKRRGVLPVFCVWTPLTELRQCSRMVYVTVSVCRGIQ